MSQNERIAIERALPAFEDMTPRQVVCKWHADMSEANPNDDEGTAIEDSAILEGLRK